MPSLSSNSRVELPSSIITSQLCSDIAVKLKLSKLLPVLFILNMYVNISDRFPDLLPGASTLTPAVCFKIVIFL